MNTRALVMLYDGGCGICRRAGAWMAARDRDARIELLPLQDATVPRRFPQFDRSALEASLHVVSADGRAWHGAAACAALVRALPGGWAWSWIFRLPGAEWAYAQVAKRRARTGCEVGVAKT